MKGTDTILVISYYGIFVLLLLTISLFLLIQSFKAEKIAKPFLYSLVVFFLAYAFANFFLTLNNVETFINGDLVVYDQKANSFFTNICAVIAPLLLTFQVEKRFLTDTKFLSKYHIFFVLNLISFCIIGTITIVVLITNPILLFDPAFATATFGAFILPFFSISNIFFMVAFAYLSKKSTGKFRTYAFIIGFGWLINQCGNLLHQFVNASLLNNVTTTIFFMAKWIGTFMTAYGFYKLYTMKNI